MTDYNRYLQDELDGKHKTWDDDWRPRFDETFAKATPEERKVVARVQEIEANLRSVTLLEGYIFTKYQLTVAEGRSLGTCACYLSVHSGRHQLTGEPYMTRQELIISAKSIGGEIRVKRGWGDLAEVYVGTVDEATKLAIKLLAHLAK